jgi:formamidopyrimidine-DNA glycosylase
LSKEAGLKFWRDILKSGAGIKNLMLDQQVIRGIGNAYADEILWTAGISPFSKANQIPVKKIPQLVKAVRSVLQSAEKQIQKKEPGIIGGEIRDFLCIHNSKKKKSPAGAPILFAIKGGRKTYYTREQQLYK